MRSIRSFVSRSARFVPAIGLLAGAASLSSPAAGQAGREPLICPAVAGPEPCISHEVSPTRIDAAAMQPDNKHTGKPNEHLVFVPKGFGAQHLFLFIGGTHHYPRGTQLVMKTAIERGYNAIAVAYPNEEPIAAICSVRVGSLAGLRPDCTGDARSEFVTGKGGATVKDVAERDSIMVRTRKLLVHLRDTFPKEGWGRFLTPSGDVDWRLVSVAGHSQGAGHAAYLGKVVEVRRVGIISGVADVYAGTPAKWLRMKGATPADRQYGFSHNLDTAVPRLVATNSWDALGMPPLTVSVDRDPPPYRDANRLLTGAPPARGTNFHVSTIGDRATPKNARGEPVYAPVWAHIALP